MSLPPSLPLNITLSRLWAKACGLPRVTGDVYIEFTDKPVRTTTAHWIEARPVAKDLKQYRFYECAYVENTGRYTEKNLVNQADRSGIYLAVDIPRVMNWFKNEARRKKYVTEEILVQKSGTVKPAASQGLPCRR